MKPRLRWAPDVVVPVLLLLVALFAPPPLMRIFAAGPCWRFASWHWSIC